MSNKKTLPFDKEFILKLKKSYPTPFYIYDEAGIEKTVKELYDAFAWVPGGYKNFFAVKALPNPHVIKILLDLGMGIDTSSMAELEIAKRLGVKGEDIFFTANDVPKAEFEKARKLGAVINFDDYSYLDFYTENVAELPELVCFRYNPGPLKDGNEIIGKPQEAKYGLTKKQLFMAYDKAKNTGARRFGLHSMVVSNMLEIDYLADTARMLFELAVEIKKDLGIELEFVNLGGGVGIPYRPEDKAVDIKAYGDSVRNLHEDILGRAGLSNLKVVSEMGRYITGPHGYLVSELLHITEKYKKFAGLDASMGALMRPALYGAYHHISVLGKENQESVVRYDVTGSLCENNDKFATDRDLPELEQGDILVLHDAGAHGHAMGFQYNGKLRLAELLLRKDGSVELIRRAETLDDYFATLEF